MREDEWAPESPQENQQPWSQRLLSPPRPRPQGRVLLPRFATVECLLWTPRTGSCQCLHGERDSSCEGLRSQRSQSLLAWFSPDFRELKPLGPSLLPPGRVGQVEPKARILATQAGLRPEYPPENPCKGVGHTRPGTLRLAQYCGRPPRRGPRSPGLPWALCLCGGGRPAGKCGSRENARSSGWKGGLPVPWTRAEGPCEPGLISQGWGTLPEGGLWWGGLPCACRAP